ncbi:BH1974 [Halalkalibacterium halodurans C-125]|uniref:BH1974 protein n=1 Tax=Halalkalibacterium halodurans (strain ATCC BAA-125 / DSM 18197 / FERM 7344 / JCM 9153 / C-125) TaxID=272558 RepID=Q9KBF4_HALH5|nr:XdhC family protein [Halalkalibacterium halodurans]BAB05693.1 BH1974 [Halalkalibacterium halodurans C-125]
MSDIELLETLAGTDQPRVMATIIHVEGSSYRKEGAMMLFQEDGTQVGLLSGGCLETDLTIKAQKVWQEQLPRTVVYDLSSEDDLSWGQGSGCNGTISVLLEPVDLKLRQHLKRVYDYLCAGKSVFHVKKLSTSGAVLEYAFILDESVYFGEWHSGHPVEWIRKIDENEEPLMFTHIYSPKERLIIFGAGPDVPPLVTFASNVGFYTVVTDWRPNQCEKHFFPDADEIIVDFPADFLRKFLIRPDDFVLIMTHHFQKDQEILHFLLEKELRYIGILGSKERTRRLLQNRKPPDHLYSPVGLSIDAQGPEEIAISIVAQLIQLIRSRKQASSPFSYLFQPESCKH